MTQVGGTNMKRCARWTRAIPLGSAGRQEPPAERCSRTEQNDPLPTVADRTKQRSALGFTRLGWTTLGLLAIAGLALAVAGVSQATEQGSKSEVQAKATSPAVSIRLRQVAPKQDRQVEPASAEVWIESEAADKKGDTPSEKAEASTLRILTPQAESAEATEPARAKTSRPTASSIRRLSLQVASPVEASTKPKALKPAEPKAAPATPTARLASKQSTESSPGAQAAATALVTDDPTASEAQPIGTETISARARRPASVRSQSEKSVRRSREQSAHVALLQQPTPAQPRRQADPAGEQPEAPQVAGTEKLGVFDVLDHVEEISVVLRRSKLLRTKVDIYRTSVVDSGICDVVQFTPREVSIIGRSQGATHVTFWFEDESYQPQTYLVRVVPDPEVQERREEQYGILEEILAELFPGSKVELTPMSDKLIVRGQARDAAEAAQIMAVIRGEAVDDSGRLVTGSAGVPFGREETGGTVPEVMVINMLQIPGVPQVALKVKIAELNRSAARNFGVHVNTDITFNDGSILLQSLLNPATTATTNFLGTFDADKLKFGFNYLQKHGVVRLLSEPTLVTISGRPASFIAGGEFAVPTTVGVGGAAAVTTDFRSFGAIITFLPTVLDKDMIRLEVAPEFSKIDEDLQNTSTGVPGLQTRAVTTTVEMREGQTLAIAGLLEDSMNGSNQGDLPFVAKVFGKREMTRGETELLILVTPELVHPMEPEAVPPLPGFDVTEPTNCEFFLKGRLEGRPTHEYRSTIWPQLRRRYQAGGPAMISGPFGHGE